MSAEPQMLPTGTRVDRYEIVEPLGRGGFSTVYTATHAHLGHPIALKLLHPSHSGSPEMVERFFREARAAAAVGNPHIVEVIDCGHAPDGQPFLAMELLEGIALEDLLEESGGTLPVERAVTIALQTLDGLQAAHAAGIIHRDLKPANIFVTSHHSADVDFVKILDFGISKIRSESLEVALTQTGAVLGTPLFMAPEQFVNARDVDHRCDIYSLSAVIYRMLSGKTTFDAGSIGEIAHRVTSQPIAPLQSLAPHVPRGLCQVVERGLAKDPDARWSSSSDLARALKRSLDSANGALPPESVDDWALLETHAAHESTGSSSGSERATPHTWPRREIERGKAFDPEGPGAEHKRSMVENEPIRGSIDGDHERRRWALVLASALVVLLFFGVTMVVGFLIGAQRARRQDSPTLTAPTLTKSPPPLAQVGAANSNANPSTPTTQPLVLPSMPAPAPSGWPAPQQPQVPPAPVVTPPPQLPAAAPQPAAPQPPLGTVTIVSTQVLGTVDESSVNELLQRSRPSMEGCRVQGQNITVRAQLMINPPEASSRRIAVAQAFYQETSHRDAARCCALAAREVAGGSWQPEGNGIVNFEVELRAR